MGFSLQMFMEDLMQATTQKGICPEDRLELLAELVLAGNIYAAECGQINKIGE